MLSTLGVILIAAASAIVFFALGATTILLGLRYKDRRHRVKKEVDRHLRNGQRMRLSVGSGNCSQVPEPRTILRRSAHLPYGIISERHAPSEEELNQTREFQPSRQRMTGSARPTDSIERRRSLRASFSAHSFSLPKTRRQKKIEKAIPLRALPGSPLSAITEQSGSNHTEASPSVGIAELPAETTPRPTPEREDQSRAIKRPGSVQWPLPATKRESYYDRPTIIPVSPSRHSIQSTMSTNSDRHSAPDYSLGPRTTSFSSQISVAPGEPLPPLPSITPYQWSYGRKPNFRLSATSVDTIGSSLLGSELMSPSRTETETTSIGLGSPFVDAHASKMQAHQRKSQEWGPATVTTGSSEGRHPIRQPGSGLASGSMRASFGVQSSPQRAANSHMSQTADRRSSIPRTSGCSLVTLDASNWKAGPPNRAQSMRSNVSPSFPAPISRTGSAYQKNGPLSRHSMFEQSARNMIPTVLGSSNNLSTPSPSPPRLRPTSTLSDNRASWNGTNLPAARPSSDSLRKGHKRQNCVRISNLPQLNTSRRPGKLPLMVEENEEDLGTSTSAASTIPGLSLLAQAKSKRDNEETEVSPFAVKPFLKPGGWNTSQRSKVNSPDARQRDSDVFRNSRYDPTAPNIFRESSTLRHPWPSSPTPTDRDRKLPSPNSVGYARERDASALPLPLYSSATSIGGRSQPASKGRTSVVQGPRSLPRTGRSSRAFPSSPTITRPSAKRDDLRRSVMTLRRMNSDAKDKTRVSQIYCNIGDETMMLLEDRGDTTPTSSSRASSINFSPANHIHRLSRTSSKVTSSSPQRGLSASPISMTHLAPVAGSGKAERQIDPSPSVISIGASIWEDASVRGESPEPELPPLSKLSSPVAFDFEACENLLVGNAPRQMKHGRKENANKEARSRGLDWESRLTSPQGKGLGLTGVQLSRNGSWIDKLCSTPGLYDRDGFLKD